MQEEAQGCGRHHSMAVPSTASKSLSRAFVASNQLQEAAMNLTERLTQYGMTEREDGTLMPCWEMSLP
jgi:hypothetical protein